MKNEIKLPSTKQLRVSFLSFFCCSVMFSTDAYAATPNAELPGATNSVKSLPPVNNNVPFSNKVNSLKPVVNNHLTPEINGVGIPQATTDNDRSSKPVSATPANNTGETSRKSNTKQPSKINNKPVSNRPVKRSIDKNAPFIQQVIPTGVPIVRPNKPQSNNLVAVPIVKEESGKSPLNKSGSTYRNSYKPDGKGFVPMVVAPIPNMNFQKEQKVNHSNGFVPLNNLDSKTKSVPSGTDFRPKKIMTNELTISGYKFSPLIVNTAELSISAYKFQPVVVNTSELTITAYAFNPVVINTGELSITAYLFKPLVINTKELSISGAQ